MYTLSLMAGRPPTKDAPLFGQRLASLRKAKGWSQAQFARRLNLTREMVDYYERRAKNPSLEFIQQAAQTLEVTVSELLGMDETPSSTAKRGPTPQIQLRLERIQRLPRKEQDFILKFLDTFLEQHERAS